MSVKQRRLGGDGGDEGAEVPPRTSSAAADFGAGRKLCERGANGTAEKKVEAPNSNGKVWFRVRRSNHVQLGEAQICDVI